FAQIFNDVCEVFAVAHLQVEDQGRGVAVALVDGDVLDVRLCGGDVRGDRGQHAHAVRHVDADFDVEQAVDVRLPGDRQPLVRLLAVVAQVAARLAVNDDAAAAGQ